MGVGTMQDVANVVIVERLSRYPYCRLLQIFARVHLREVEIDVLHMLHSRWFASYERQP